jgi:hypothetical protein
MCWYIMLLDGYLSETHHDITHPAFQRFSKSAEYTMATKAFAAPWLKKDSAREAVLTRILNVC